MLVKDEKEQSDLRTEGIPLSPFISFCRTNLGIISVMSNLTAIAVSSFLVRKTLNKLENMKGKNFNILHWKAYVQSPLLYLHILFRWWRSQVSLLFYSGVQIHEEERPLQDHMSHISEQRRPRGSCWSVANTDKKGRSIPGADLRPAH